MRLPGPKNCFMRPTSDSQADAARLDPRQRLAGVPHEVLSSSVQMLWLKMTGQVIRTQVAVKQTALEARAMDECLEGAVQAEKAEDAFYAQSAALQD